MAGWTVHEGEAVVLPHDNIDTDQIIPARFMSASRADGYGGFLLHDLRRNADGELLQDFPLNRHPNASIIVAGRNFGNGSSREAAVYALVDAGVRVVIAPAFGDIFAANAVNNGLLPACVEETDAERLMHSLEQEAGPITVDLGNCSIASGLIECGFKLEENWRTKLVKGWDDIDLTLQCEAEINRFKRQRIQTAPWAWPSAAE